MAEFNAESLENMELIASLIGSGSRDANAVELAGKILSLAGGDIKKLSQLPASDLSSFAGIRGKNAAQYSPPLNSTAEYMPPELKSTI